MRRSMRYIRLQGAESVGSQTQTSLHNPTSAGLVNVHEGLSVEFPTEVDTPMSNVQDNQSQWLDNPTKQSDLEPD